jgi:hypothetical protein
VPPIIALKDSILSFFRGSESNNSLGGMDILWGVNLKVTCGNFVRLNFAAKNEH